MEWCCASNIGDRVVPKNQEVSESFPSPESWLHKWGRTEPENFAFPNKGFAMDNNFNGGILSDEVEMESCTYDKDWSSSGGRSQESSFQQTLDYQLLSLAGLESTDDIYLSSLIEDVPGNEEFYNSYSMEPEMQSDMLDCDTFSADMMLNTKSTSIDSHSMGSSKYLKTHAFSPSDQENGRVSTPQCNSQLTHCPSVKIPTGNNNANEQMDEETCLEESVLEQLGMVMSQMTEKTRLCFRDGLYRLANNSRQHGATHNENGFASLETPTWSGQEGEMRLEGKKTRESETNTIDRTIANLLFNKMDTNVNDYPVSASISSQDESLEQSRLPNCSTSSLPQYTSFSSDNDVSMTRVVPNIQISQNPA
ncbi:protein LNK3-like [Euphorbia lathyris]|uniref:protein LNK3-like n=1 Tax=Euphorbia lathyris TaxID=212925 RepID=UPI0033144D40